MWYLSLVFPEIVVHQNGWFRMKTLLKWMIWGENHYFWKQPYATEHLWMLQIFFVQVNLGGGNSNIFYFHPNLGKIPILTSIFFRWVGSTTNQKWMMPSSWIPKNIQVDDFWLLGWVRFAKWVLRHHGWGACLWCQDRPGWIFFCGKGGLNVTGIVDERNKNAMNVNGFEGKAFHWNVCLLFFQVYSLVPCKS